METARQHDNTLPPNPQAEASILSRLTFGWTIGIFKKCYKQELEEKDLYAPLEEHKSSQLGDILDRYWKAEVEAASKKKRPPSLLKAVIRCYGLNLFLLSLLNFIGEPVLKCAQPLLLAKLLEHFSPNSAVSRSEAMGYAMGVLLCTAGNIIIMNPMGLALLHVAMKIRVACCSLMYRKMLRLSRSALNQTTTGHIVNLMSNDVNRFETHVLFLNLVWIGPLTVIIVSILLWRVVGIAALVGVAPVLAAIPLQTWLGKQKSNYRLKTAKRTDDRIHLMTEIINGISVIKMYTWEILFQKLVTEARRLEIKEIRRSSYITGIMLSFLMFTNRLSICCCVVTYVLMGNIITAAIVYVITAYYNIIRQSKLDLFPVGVSCGAEVLISFKRIESFLLLEDINDKQHIEENGNINLAFDNGDDKEKKLSNVIDCDTGNKNIVPLNNVILKNASAKWSKDSNNTLSEVNIDFPPGKLTFVVGQVGSGKSSVLQALLGELPLTSGAVRVGGGVSYASQEPWLFEASLRQNILFGCPYDTARYNSVVSVCGLLPDLQQLSHGDSTLVGDRGIILSGGQRARINLARAVYRDSDVYLLDDPLSAVDSRVGNHIFQQCISGYLKGKTVILVTHQMQFLHAADYIVLLKDGKVSIQGTYEDLKMSSTEFCSLMSETNSGEEDHLNSAGESQEELESKTEIKVQKDVEREKEMRTKGSVSGEVFKKYFTAGGSVGPALFVLFAFFFSQFVGSAGDYWLNYWVNLEEYVYNLDPNVTSTVHPDILFYVPQSWCIPVFTFLVAATIIIAFARSCFFMFLCMRSSMWLHNTMFASLTRAAMRFFHTNQAGRILNRFTKDMGTVDENMPTSLLYVLQIGFLVLGIVGLLALINTWLLLPTLVIAYVFYFLRKCYIKTSCGVKRLEGITRSPVFSHLNASLQGLSTIRAMKAEAILEREFDDHQDLNSSANYIFLATTRAFGYWLDIVCFVYVSCITFSFFIFESAWYGGSVGLAITQSVNLVGVFQFGMKQYAETENSMTSVERILEYTKIPEEPPLESPKELKPSSEWPSEGRIEFRQVVMTYDSSLPPTLKDISFVIQPREKVGIVGRTGAGKSSLTSALFRLTPVQGSIIIDNIDVTQIGLHDLRSKLSIISQEPFLFNGTVRKNLDPFDEFPDDKLWTALLEVEMKDVIENLPEGLNTQVTEGGSNLSVGQRQLMCLARAIVRNNRILVMDEATANIDLQTDTFIQRTIRHRFAECTVLTIAHRLNTIMDSDKVLVMDNGNVVEFDHPHVLLSNVHGHFYSMVDQLGKNVAESLHNIATLNYNQHH